MADYDLIPNANNYPGGVGAGGYKPSDISFLSTPNSVDVGNRGGGGLPPDMKTLLDKILSYSESGRRTGQSAAQGRSLNEAFATLGGVYGHNLSAAAAGAANKTAEEQLALEKKKALMPLGGGVGNITPNDTTGGTPGMTSPDDKTIKQKLDELKKRSLGDYFNAKDHPELFK